MKTKVTIEENTTKIVLTPQNDFEEDVIEKCKDKKYSMIAKVDYLEQPFGNSKHVIELMLSSNAGIVDLYPELRKEYYSQIHLIKSIFEKVSKLKSTNAIEEIKTEIESYLSKPSKQY